MKNISLIYPIDGIETPLRNNFLVFDIPPLSMSFMANYPSDLSITFIEEFQGEVYDYKESDVLCIFFNPRKQHRVNELITNYKNDSYIILFGFGLASLDINPDGTNITGEIETLWPQILADAKEGKIAKEYKPKNGFDLFSLYNNSQLIKYDLEGFDEITPLELQRSNYSYYNHEIDHLITESLLSTEELRKLLTKYDQADNYFFRAYTDDFFKNNLLQVFAKEGKKWGMRLPAYLLKHLNDSNLVGCKFLMIDTINEEFQNIKFGENSEIKLIPNMTFKLTSKSHAEGLFESAYEFLSANGLDFAITQLYFPLPGSHAHSEDSKNNLILTETDISRYDGCHQLLVSEMTTPQELEMSYISFVRRYNRFVFRKHTIDAN